MDVVVDQHLYAASDEALLREVYRRGLAEKVQLRRR
jgi:hypothetical protein